MKAAFFTRNRQRLRDVVDTPLIIIAGNDEMQRKADAAYAFVQESNFYYLTGIEEAGWKLVIDGVEERLVSPDRSESQALFDGSLTADEARTASGIQTIMSLADWQRYLEERARTYDAVATIGEDIHKEHYSFSMNPGPLNALTQLHSYFATATDIRPALARLRAIKQPEEIAVMRKAITITSAAFAAIYGDIASYEHEGAIAGRLSYEFLRSGARGHAYDPIVASGTAACTLHYGKNNAPLKKGELVLIDAGAECEGYAADITRTYAVGSPTDRQKEVHEAVVDAHHKIIDFIKPGVSLREYSEHADAVMTDALKRIGLYSSPDDFRKYFPHAISHGLGSDVHESLGGYTEFMPGMILTVEPGIYIPEEDIGIRIEDDILVTADGNENLSQALSTAL